MSDGPTIETLPEWLAADPAHTVLVVAPDARVASDWAKDRGVRRFTPVITAAGLWGIYGDDHAIVRLGGGATQGRRSRQMVNALAVAAAAEVWMLEDGLPETAEPPPVIGGATLINGGVIVRRREEGDADVFHLASTGGGVVLGITRDQLPQLMEAMRAWAAAEPYVDPAQAGAEAIRAAALASGDPFARP